MLLVRAVGHSRACRCHCITRVARTLQRRAVATGPRAVYDKLVAAGQLRADAHQLRCIDELQATWGSLRGYEPPQPEERTTRKGFWPRSFFRASKADAPPSQRGLYMHGTVGTGKTMLMDLFYATVEDPRKRRVHFHAFMNSVHQSIHQLKAGSGGGETPDIIPRIAAQWSRTAWLLCFDEFQVTDIADAMILRVLMEELHARGIVMVATSNRAPDELYSNGIQRESFVPCIALIKRSCKTLNLNSDTDYRRLSKKSSLPLFLTPQSEDNVALFRRYEAALLDGARWSPSSVETMGRTVEIRRARLHGANTAIFDFQELFFQPLSAADYISICAKFAVILVENATQLTLLHRNEARRLINFIDAAYEQKCKVICLSHVSMLNLFTPESGGAAFDRLLMDDLHLCEADTKTNTLFTGNEEAFAFQRTLSRLIEMQSDAWLGDDLARTLTNVKGD